MRRWFSRRRRASLDYRTGGIHALTDVANSLDAVGEHMAAGYVRAGLEAWKDDHR